MAQSIIKVDNLTKIFTRKGQPDFIAVDHVSFELYPGECLGLIGESGSGSYLLKISVVHVRNSSKLYKFCRRSFTHEHVVDHIVNLPSVVGLNDLDAENLGTVFVFVGDAEPSVA